MIFKINLSLRWYLVSIAFFSTVLCKGQITQLQLDNGVKRDANNREIVLNGCVTITHHANGFQPYTLDDYKRLKSWGANYQSIRLFASTIGADGSTTFPVFYAAIDSMVSRAKQVGIYTEFKLTMYGGAPYVWEDLWLDNNDAQQNLIDGWQSVWSRYINEPAVIGYDLINEPEQGSLVTASDSIFVCDYLNPVYQMLVDSLQAIDPSKFSLIQPVLDEFNTATGVVDYYEYPCAIERTNVFYAPHFYVKISYPYEVSGYIDRINRYQAEAQLHNAPLFIGEYGIPWNQTDDGNTIKELQHGLTEKICVAIFDSLKIGFSRPWFADDNAEVSGTPQLNWALIKGDGGLSGDERTFILDVFCRPYPRATAGNLQNYQYYFDDNRFEMSYISDGSFGQTEIFTAQNRHFQDTLILQYNGNCFILDTLTKTFEELYNFDGIDPSNFEWDDENEIVTINDWTNGLNEIELLNHTSCQFNHIDTISGTSLSLFPNPSSGQVKINRTQYSSEILRIYDFSGKLIISKKVNGLTVLLDISELSKGIYTIAIDGQWQKLLKV